MSPSACLRRSSALLLALVTLAGCGASRSAPPAAAVPARLAADELPACTASVGGADLTGWREVQGPGFRLCVPGTWARAALIDSSGSAGGRWIARPGRAIEWQAGPVAPGRGAAIPFNQREVRELWFDGRPGQLMITSIQDSHSMFVTYAATARAPELRLSAFARGPAAEAELLTVLQSLQGPSTP